MKSKVVYCWNCKTAMDLKGDYYQCSSCGATWNEVATLGASPLTEVDAESGGSPKAGRDTRLRPSGALSRHASLQREKSKGGKL